MFPHNSHEYDSCWGGGGWLKSFGGSLKEFGLGASMDEFSSLQGQNEQNPSLRAYPHHLQVHSAYNWSLPRGSILLLLLSFDRAYLETHVSLGESLENNNNDGRILKSHEKLRSLKASIKQCATDAADAAKDDTVKWYPDTNAEITVGVPMPPPLSTDGGFLIRLIRFVK
ncbi:hypothetical protein Tco_1281075 [Tanacetum coccineum]